MVDGLIQSITLTVTTMSFSEGLNITPLDINVIQIYIKIIHP